MEDEKVQFSDFHSFFNAFWWKPIYGCPGRFILKEKKQYTLTELTGNKIDIKTYSTPKARDVVCVAVLADGGIISYKRNDGSFIHTLNTKPGFLRKLKMLDITLTGC